MKRIKVFISSVQSEFAAERRALYEYLTTDALFGRFFESFIFENLPAIDQRADAVYLEEVTKCDIYLGIFGTVYGFEDTEGISPTEREFDQATILHKTRLVFLTQHKTSDRDPKELQLIRKAENAVVRKKFTSPDDLKFAVYAALIRYLEDKDFIRTGPYDAAICKGAGLEDLDHERIAEFVHLARARRGFPLPADADPMKILTHLNLVHENGLTNAAVLLFGKQPQRFLISSEIKCAQFHGNEVRKPIPSYHVYKGDLFQLVNQAVDFVLSRIDLRVGTREASVEVPIEYEIPMTAVTEAIVNAIAHRDYTSTGSVQVMLFRNRLEIWNPGQLPNNLTFEKIKHAHSSQPFNPLIAEPLYLAGFIERLGTGIPDMIEVCKKAGLNEPEFAQEDTFRAILWRANAVAEEATLQASGEATLQATLQGTDRTGQVETLDSQHVNNELIGVTGQVTRQASGEASGEVTGEPGEEIKRIVLVLFGEAKRAEIQRKLELKSDDYFRVNYIIPALESGHIEMTYQESPNHPNQRYRLTDKGIELKKRLKNSKKNK